MKKFVCCGSVVIASMGFWVATAQAALVLEWNFDSPTNPQYASYSNGVNGTTTLIGTTAVVAGGVGTPTGPGTGVVSALQFNSLRVPDAAYTAGGMDTAASSFANVFGGANTSFASGTVALVFRPSVIHQGQRQYLFNSADPGVPQNISLLESDTGSGSSKPLTVSGGRGTENDFNLTTAPITWDTNDWYFIAMSWQSSSGVDLTDPNGNSSFYGLPNGKLSIYVHSMRDGQTGTYTPDGSALASLDNSTERLLYPVNRPASFGNALNIGRRSNSDITGAGDYAFIQFYNGYMNAAQLSFEFANEFIPEPSTALLAVFGSFLFLRKRH